MGHATLKGLYVITDDTLCGDNLAGCVEQAIRGGAAMVQYRSKQGSLAQRQQQATELLAICRPANVPFLVNDDPALAQSVGADGVHLGQADTRLAEARSLLGEECIIGVTCHDSVPLAKKAQDGGADYVAFGRFFASNTKPEAPPADVHILAQAKQQLTIPVCAIGGITPANAPVLLEAGADMLAIIHGVFGQPDIEAAAQNYAVLFEYPKQRR